MCLLHCSKTNIYNSLHPPCTFSVATMFSGKQDRPTPLVSHRDEVVEGFLNQVFDSLSVPLHTSATELARIWKDEVQEKISHQSIVLSHRTSPLVQIMLEQRVKQVLDSTFVKVQCGEQDFKTMVENYSKCFSKWVEVNSPLPLSSSII